MTELIKTKKTTGSVSFKNHESSLAAISDDNIELDLHRYSSLDRLTANNKSKSSNSKFAFIINYRLIKTFLLILTWISFGLNFELIGSTMEDLKIYLDVNYSKYSFGLVLRNTGYLTLTFLLGFILDKLTSYADILMALSSLILGFTSYFIPITRNYFMAMSYYLAQGLCQAVYDLTGNVMIINLWSEINSSPINAMHGGYGIGAILATQIAKPFIKFEPPITKQIIFISSSSSNDKNSTQSILKILRLETNLSNNSYNLNNEIDLRTPYWISGSISILIAFIFLATQFYESKNKHNNSKKKREFMLLTEDLSDNEINDDDNEQENNEKIKYFMKNLLFSDKTYTGKALVYMLVQIGLFMLVFVLTQGSFTVITRFMLTYLTKGPANLDIKTYSIIISLFWALFIFSRFISTYLAVIIDPIYFFLIILFMNSFVSALFLVPALTTYEIFFWIALPVLGATSGPIMPTGLMIAKEIINFNSFVLSLFIVGMASGGILFQQLTGELLDHFDVNNNNDSKYWMGFKNINSSYAIPHLIFLSSFLALITFLPIFILFKKWNQAMFYKIQTNQ